MTPEERAAHCRRIGQLGGRATMERHGREHMAEIGKRGFAVAMETVGGHWLYEHRLKSSYRAKYGRDPVRKLSAEEYRARQRVREEARRRYPGGHQCEAPGCAEPAQRHHVDGLAAGNEPENVRFLCSTHHQAAHREQRRELREVRRSNGRAEG